MSFVLLSLFLLLAASAHAQNSTQAGRFTVEHPTLHNLGFEWTISGDANRNASVSVEFRRSGESGWRPALPLVRVGGEHVFRKREHLDYTVPDGFAGSILNLEPGTEYECRLELRDPDGATGQTTETVRVRTRTEPQPHEGGRVLHVYPPYHEGDRLEPHFSSLLQAYYGSGLGDWSVVWERRAQPGDTILVHAGLYRNDRLNYVDPMMTPFDGTMSLTLKGTPERPITIKAAGDGEVVFDGASNHRLFDVMASAYHIFDGLTFRNTDVAIFAGQKEVLGAVGLAEQYRWLAPRGGRLMYEPQRSDWRTFSRLEEFRAATGQENHGLELDFDIFEEMTPPDPSRRHAVYHAMDLSFRLKPNSKAVDAGVRIPTVNDDFSGDAPDLGALEVGQPEPHYGPRWLKRQPFYR